MPKDIVMGLGEIGYPIFQVLSKKSTVVGYDIDPKLMNKKQFEKSKNEKTNFLHICIPFTNNFGKTIFTAVKKFDPKCVVIHSTIKPHTTEKLQKKLKIPVIYSATRGIHKRMLADLKRYTKFYSVYDWAPNVVWANKNFVSSMKKSGIKTKKISTPLTLELAKIVCDTSYYGWLITYAQLSNMIAIKNGVDYDEMWSFSDEIQKFLKNRPKMFPGFIGGHCVIPNLELINDKNLDLIDDINQVYLKNVKNAKSIAKKYLKKR